VSARFGARGALRIIPRFADAGAEPISLAMTEPKPRSGAWRRWDDDDAADAGFRRLTPAEAVALKANNPSLSPWRVIAAQAVVGGGVALLAGLAGGGREYVWSALYGAVTAVVPGALLARGMTSRLSSLTPAVSAVSVMLWETVKIAASVVLLVVAPKVVTPLSWPALLAGLAACLSVYWFALLWRGRKS
jgi:ATP synthase protein I